MSLVCFSQNNETDTLNFARKSLQLRQKMKNNHNDVIESYIHSGSIYNYLGIFDKSYSNLLKASELLRNFPNKKLQTEYYLNLSSYYHSTKDSIRSEENFLKYIEGIKEEYGDNCTQLVVTYHSLGLMYKKLLNYDKALEVFHKALRIHEKIKGTYNKTTTDILEDIGDIHRIKRNFEEALNFINKACKIKF